MARRANLTPVAARTGDKGAHVELEGARVIEHGRRFASPCEVGTPPGAEGWSELYHYAVPFDPSRREDDDDVFWFRESIHWPRPLRPIEATIVQYALTSLGQFNHRHFVVPTARGFEFRVLNGYCYISPGAVEDPDEIAERTTAFRERAGHYFEHWDELYADWKERVLDLLGRLDALTFPGLPDTVPVAEATHGRGLGRVHHLSHRFHELLDLAVELWQYHFEFLNLGYAAYLDYFCFCRSHCADLSDLAIARTVAGIDVDLFRPDQELRRLAKAAVAAGLGEVLCRGPVQDVPVALAAAPGGPEWLADFDRVQHPWFNFSTGSGFYHDDAVWADRLDVPLGFIRDYVTQLLAGDGIDVPRDDVAADRDRLAAEIRARLDDADRATFDAKLALSRTVFPYVENHNFYIEHWGMSLVWRKFRALSAVFVKEAFWNATDDIFLLRPEEIDAALWDMLGAWASGRPAVGPSRWPAELERRKAILEACARVTPPPALGRPPARVDDAFCTMLWGVTPETIQGWLDGATGCSELRGLAVSPGAVTGRARVVLSADALDDVEDGEILVAENTMPSWASVFARVAATVTEVGGMMSHAAIVCREYGMPAVVGVAGVTRTVRTGQVLHFDGSTGVVTVVG